MYAEYEVIGSAQEVNVSKTVHEHRAPTDESIRLYSEMRERAIESILWELDISNTLISGRIRAWVDPFQDLVVVGYKIKMNLKEIIGDVKVNRVTDKDAAIRKVYRDISEKIASSILKEYERELVNTIG